MGDPSSFPVQYLKGVGPSRAAYLQRLGISTAQDLLFHFPRRYEDRRTAVQLLPEMIGEVVTVCGTVLGGEEYQPRQGFKVTKVALDYGGGLVYATWFNQPYILRRMGKGKNLSVVGRLRRFLNAFEINVQEYEILDGEEDRTKGLVPVYPSTDRMPQKTLRKLVRQALDKWSATVEDVLPDEFLSRHGLPRVKAALETIHFPPSLDAAAAARRRFATEEMLLLQLALGLRRQSVKTLHKPHRYGEDGCLVKSLVASLPYRLTGAQERVWREISSDLSSGRPAQRLLQGDVGSGKTVIAALAMLKAAENGYQAALMVPTEILAEQHYRRLREMYIPLGVEIGLLTGSQKVRERRLLLDGIANNHYKVLVGTHALIQSEVSFARLALAIVDEQHRFGVRQRMSLQDKGFVTDTLVMTATPIPRTVALTLYGDLDLSIIDELPPGRLPVRTGLVKSASLAKVWHHIRHEVSRGGQAYLVCPLIEESENLSSKAAADLAKKLAAEVFPDLRLALLHGRLKPEEKERIMESFRQGQIDILVATTVIEVGVDVPQANTIVIFDADRFGLAQLHQLRGRVGRAGGQGWCILVSDSNVPETLERLRVLCRTGDGFELAEADLKARGPGDYFGTRQSGLPELRAADLTDSRLIARMQAEARQILNQDPALEQPQHRGLQKELRLKYGPFLNGLGIT